jgi:hypothetical protein
VADPVQPAGPAPIASDDEGEALKKRDFEARQAELARGQNLQQEGAVPEQRPIASQTVDDPHSEVFKKLQEAGDPRAGVPAMDKAAYDRAASKSQAQAAAKESIAETRLFPGARGWIDNPGAPDHGRAVAVNRVTQYKTGQDATNAVSGIPELMRQAAPAEYECMTRDGRAELMLVSAEHIRADTSGGNDWGKTPLTTPLS